MKEIYQHPTLGAVTLYSSRRSRNISLKVKPSGQVWLSYPAYGAKRQALEFLQSRIEWVKAARERYAQRPQAEPPTAEQIDRMRQEAKQYLPQRVEQLASAYGLRYGKVTIRKARSKWGSCTSANNISLSLYMMMLPTHLQDYIITHELCHTVHHNHSAAFHALVDRLTGGRERELAKELRAYTIP